MIRYVLALLAFSSPVWAAPALLDAELDADISADLAPEWQTEAEIQIEAEQYGNAEALLQNGIQQLEDGHHRYHRDLVAPLTLLGDTQYQQGAYGDAAESYQRATHISRVNDGLHSPSQIDAVYREARTFTAMGDLAKANEREEYAYNVMLRSYGAYDKRLLAGLFHLAQWYEQTNNIFSARGLYGHAVELIDATMDEQAPELVQALEGLSRSYRLERFPPIYLGDATEVDGDFRASNASIHSGVVVVNNFSAGEQTLQRLVKLHRDAPAADQGAIINAILDLADWYLLFKKNSRANDLYGHVYNVLTQAPAVDAAAYFGTPKLLHYPKPRNPDLDPARVGEEPLTGHVHVAFDVTSQGFVSNLKTVSSQPADVMDFRVRRSMRYARYRPALTDGKPVSYSGHEYVWEFPYYPPDGMTLPDQNTPEEADEPTEPVVLGTATVQDR